MTIQYNPFCYFVDYRGHWWTNGLMKQCFIGCNAPIKPTLGRYRWYQNYLKQLMVWQIQFFLYLLPPPDGVFKSDWNLLSGLFPPCEILSSGWISFRQMVRLTLIWFFSYTSAADWFDELTRRHSLQIFNCKLTLLLGHQPDMEILDPLHEWTEWIRQYDVDGVDRQVLPWSVSADGQQVLFF